jgi:hypothetical protein
MPKLNKHVMRSWLDNHNWSIDHLADECTTLGKERFPKGTVRNAVYGIDPMRPDRIHVICAVTAKYGDGLTYERLAFTDEEQSEQTGDL